MTSRYAVLIVVILLVVGACTETDTAVIEPELATVDCFSVIDALDEPPFDYTVVSGVVAFGGSDNADTPLQAVWNEQSGWFGSKTGLLVRSGSTVTVSVPPDVQDRVNIGWGGSGGPWEVRISGCDRAEEWVVFAGGIGVRAPECVPLTVNDGATEQRVMIGVGAPCPGQEPLSVPALSSTKSTDTTVATSTVTSTPVPEVSCSSPPC
jgi:hypothetical protein